MLSLLSRPYLCCLYYSDLIYVVLIIQTLLYNCFRLCSSFKEICEQARAWTDNSINYLQIEFASGGNVRFEEGSAADVW